MINIRIDANVEAVIRSLVKFKEKVPEAALDALYEKELIYEEDGSLFLQDVALSRWMELQ